MRIALALFIICASAAAQEAVRTARWMCSSAAIDGATLRDQAGHLPATLSGPVRTGAAHIALEALDRVRVHCLRGARGGLLRRRLPVGEPRGDRALDCA